MAPVATTEKTNGRDIASLKQAAQTFNPFYSPPTMDENDGDYKFAQYKVWYMPDVVCHQVIDRRSPH